MTKFRIPVPILLTTALLGATACTGKNEPKNEEPVRVIGADHVYISRDALENLKLASAVEADFPETLQVMGKVSPAEDRTWVVPARTAGRIESVLIASGETVTAGQPLAKIFSPDFIAAREEYLQSLRLDKKQSSAGSSRDFANLAKLSYKKLESLGLSKADIAQLSGQAAQADGADALPGSSETLLVRAPKSGAIITKNAIVGNQVNQGDPLFMIADLHQVWFLGDLYPEDVPKVKKNQEVVITTADGKPLEGRVSFISPVVDPNTRTIKIRALINNPSLSLRADMYLQGGLVLNHQKALLVPSKAIFRDQNENYIFRIQSSKVVEGSTSGVEAVKVKVAVTGERQGQTAITAGIMPGQQIVAEGALLLNAALSNSGK